MKFFIDFLASGRFWYHASSLENIQQIIKFGIKLDEGKKRGNFSNGDGFYCSDDLTKVLQFGASKFPGNDSIAILIFNWDKDKTEFKGLDLTSLKEEERLRKVVSYFKNGAIPLEPSMELHGLESNYNGLYVRQEGKLDYIYGPYADFYGQGRNTRPEDANLYRDMTQLCVRSYDLALRFDEGMVKSPIVLKGERWEKIKKETGEFLRAEKIRLQASQAGPCQTKY